MKASSYIRSAIALLGGLLVSAQAKADDYGLTAAAPSQLVKSSLDAPGAIGRVLAIALGFTGTIFFILVVYAGLTWMLAAGNEENIKKAQSILKTSIVGLILVLSAYAITQFIGTQLIK